MIYIENLTLQSGIRILNRILFKKKSGKQIEIYYFFATKPANIFVKCVETVIGPAFEKLEFWPEKEPT